MKQLAMVVGLSVFTYLAWQVGSHLSSDALAMAVGLLFGMLAGVPTLLLVMASQRQRRPYDDDAADDTPVVHITYNVTNNTDNRQLTINTGAQGMPLLTDRQREITAQRSGRVFKVVGERAEWDGGE